MNNILLNPGPTNTLECVKNAQTQHSDICHRTDEFIDLLVETKSLLLERFSTRCKSEDWNVSIFGGSGTSAMEALISSLLDKSNILIAGKYGKRAADIMSVYGVESEKHYLSSQNELEKITISNWCTNLYFVENETTTGEKFSLKEVTKRFPKSRLYIDATSAFGATDYSDYVDHIDAISFCSNKCLQSTPGLGIVIWRKSLPTRDKSYYLNLRRYVGNSLPFTLPVQSVAALNCALKESHISEHAMNYRRDRLIDDLSKINIKCISRFPSNSIIGFVHPNKNYEELKESLKKRNIIIYNGIENIKNSFRISTMSVKFDKQYNYIIGCFNDSCIY
jgi:2-aminoethylphosphonate-pyruvate transaminase